LETTALELECVPQVGDDILGLFPILDCFYTFLPIVRGRFDVLEVGRTALLAAWLVVCCTRSSPMSFAVVGKRRTSSTPRRRDGYPVISGQDPEFPINTTNYYEKHISKKTDECYIYI